MNWRYISGDDGSVLQYWRGCSLEEAIANPDLSEWRYGDIWQPMSKRNDNGNADGYVYRTRTPHPTPGAPMAQGSQSATREHDIRTIAVGSRIDVGSFRSDGESTCTLKTGSIMVVAQLPKGMWRVVLERIG